MKEIKTPSKVKDGLHYVRRHGGWFRPGAHGYTNDIAQAGTFTAEDARGYLEAEGVTVVPIASMREEVWKEMQACITRAASLAATWEQMGQKR